MKNSLKRLVTTNSGDVAARLQRPSKESNYRWGAYTLIGTRTVGTQGDTPEEACDNLRDLLNRKRS